MPGSCCCAQSQCGTPTLHAVASRANALSSTIIKRIRTAPIITLADMTARPSGVPSDLAARRGKRLSKTVTGNANTANRNALRPWNAAGPSGATKGLSFLGPRRQ